MAWLGRTDIDSSQGLKAGLGPIGKAVSERRFGQIVLISTYESETNDSYIEWLKGQTKTEIKLYYEVLTSPTNYEEIYQADIRVITKVQKEHGMQTKLAFHLSPGTPAMQAIWIILAKTRFDAELIESSPELGVRTPYIPFEIAAEFVPKLFYEADKSLEKLSVSLPPESADFAHIIHQSEVMKRVIKMAQRTALSLSPVLLEGESGTGKELFARAIHQSSPRRDKPFIAVNCGAIPENLVESELFGHIKGAFTGAANHRVGHFEQADKGTIFLDEIGELTLAAQVKLLRVLQEQEIMRVGDSKARKISVRVIVATNRKLSQEVVAGRFREDLYFRLAVLVLNIPPLRERSGDISLLIDNLWLEVKKESSPALGFEHKELSVGARNLLLQHSWPGNVRELKNVLTKVAFWSRQDKVASEDVRHILTEAIVREGDNILNRPLGNGFNLEELLGEVAQHYLSRALKESNGNKSEATKLVALPNYQTFTNWLNKYKVNG